MADSWNGAWGSSWGNSWGEQGASPQGPTFTGLAAMIQDDLDLFDDTAETLGLADDWIFD